MCSVVSYFPPSQHLLFDSARTYRKSLPQSLQCHFPPARITFALLHRGHFVRPNVLSTALLPLSNIRINNTNGQNSNLNIPPTNLMNQPISCTLFFVFWRDFYATSFSLLYHNVRLMPSALQHSVTVIIIPLLSIVALSLLFSLNIGHLEALKPVPNLCRIFPSDTQRSHSFSHTFCTILQPV